MGLVSALRTNLTASHQVSVLRIRLGLVMEKSHVLTSVVVALFLPILSSPFLQPPSPLLPDIYNTNTGVSRS